jgi:hypothetical protein
LLRRNPGLKSRLDEAMQESCLKLEISRSRKRIYRMSNFLKLVLFL